MKRFLIKLKSWEFWPVWLIYFPIFFVWIYYSIRLKSFFFFTTVNPNIIMGGFAGESKNDILKQIPAEYIPKSIFIKSKITEETFNSLVFNQLTFPCVAKPDIGERGIGVQICNSKDELLMYFHNSNFDFLVQEFVSFPLELAILYYRFPNKNKGTVSSVCQKDFLSIQGNGADNIEELMRKNERAFLQLNRFKQENPILLKRILKNKENLILDFIGNHSRGTIFLDKNNYIDDALVEAFDKLSKQIPNLNFGRYDLKCNSIEGLKQLKNFKIMEINGVSAEPAHIYEPNFSFLQAQKELLKQWHILYQISNLQIAKGIKPMSFQCAVNHLMEYKKKISLHHN